MLKQPPYWHRVYILEDFLCFGLNLLYEFSSRLSLHFKTKSFPVSFRQRQSVGSLFVNGPIREPLNQPITALTTQRGNVFYRVSAFRSLPHRLMKTCRLQSKGRGYFYHKNRDTIGEIYFKDIYINSNDGYIYIFNFIKV